MLRFILRRLMWAIPTLFIVTFLVYLAIRVGTDPLQSYLRVNQRASQEKVQQYIETNGLYEGFGGYVKGYFRWASSFLSGEWPRSIKGSREVWPELWNAMVNSMRLGGAATVLGMMIRSDQGIDVSAPELGYPEV